MKIGYKQNSSPEEILFDEKDNRQAGAGLKMGLLYPGPVVMMKKAGAPCPSALVTSNLLLPEF